MCRNMCSTLLTGRIATRDSCQKGVFCPSLHIVAERAGVANSNHARLLTCQPNNCVWAICPIELLGYFPLDASTFLTGPKKTVALSHCSNWQRLKQRALNKNQTGKWPLHSIQSFMVYPYTGLYVVCKRNYKFGSFHLRVNIFVTFL